MAKQNPTLKAASDGSGATMLEEVHVRPKFSPYKSCICSLRFASNDVHSVPEDILLRSPKLASKLNRYREIHLKEIPDDAGHVLVHFLYSGTYQTLRLEKKMSPGARQLHRFKTAVYVYAAARSNEMNKLENLAKKCMLYFAESLSVLEVFQAAQDAYQFSDDDPWFLDFITSRSDNLFDDSLSGEAGYLSCFGEVSPFSKVLLKSLRKLGCEMRESIESARTPPTQSFSPEHKTSTELVHKTVVDCEPVAELEVVHHLSEPSEPEPEPEFKNADEDIRHHLRSIKKKKIKKKINIYKNDIEPESPKGPGPEAEPTVEPKAEENGWDHWGARNMKGKIQDKADELEPPLEAPIPPDIELRDGPTEFEHGPELEMDRGAESKTDPPATEWSMMATLHQTNKGKGGR